MPQDVFINSVVEGIVDEAVVRAIAQGIGLKVHAVYGKNGKAYVRGKLDAYNQAARFAPWIVLVDLDHDETCAPRYRDQLLPSPSPQMCFRIAVREVESWLLADRDRIASFFGVAKTRIPLNPEAEHDPKQTMVNIARQSRRRAIRDDMVPRVASGRSVGPAYASRLIEFVANPQKGWRCDVAAQNCDSLLRCLSCARGFLQ